MTDADKELERLAKAATPGPWTQWMEHGEVWSGVPDRNTPGYMGGGGLRTRVCECDPDDYDGEDDDAAEEAAIATAAYIAAANPAAILSLLERLQAADQERADRLANENGRLLERVRELEARRIPTHRCRACGALWIGYPNSWSLFSKSCGSCCDNTAMGDQIEPLDSFDPRDDHKGTARLTLEQLHDIQGAMAHVYDPGYLTPALMDHAKLRDKVASMIEAKIKETTE